MTMANFGGATSKFSLALCVFLLLNAAAYASDVEEENLEFPEDLELGFATAAYQVEGAWNLSDKGENVWDWHTHQSPSPIVDGSNGDVACDSYHKYREDVELLKNMGAKFYRFSISWSRIFPTGFLGKISEDGVRYYNDLLDLLLANSIEPHVTLYHWDHPQVIEQMGGWTNDLIVEWFADYARVVFREFGSKVKFFTTINEPKSFCNDGYSGVRNAPAKNLTQIGNYLCFHNVLKAHARAYHIYDEEFRSQYGGQVSIVLPCDYGFPKTQDESSVEAVEKDYAFRCGIMAHPIFSKTGDYPAVVKKQVAENSALEGKSRSRLPEFSEEWVEYIRGTADFFALNYYNTHLIEAVSPGDDGYWYEDSGILKSFDPTWPSSASDWLKVIPAGFRRILNKIKSEYGNPPIYVMENGFSDTESLSDYGRIEYLYAHIREVLRAISLDGVNFKAYTFWSLMDNFEWAMGYSERFGIYHVNFSDPERPRTPKLSAKWVQEVLRQRKLLPVPEMK